MLLKIVLFFASLHHHIFITVNCAYASAEGEHKKVTTNQSISNGLYTVNKYVYVLLHQTNYTFTGTTVQYEYSIHTVHCVQCPRSVSYLTEYSKYVLFYDNSVSVSM